MKRQNLEKSQFNEDVVKILQNYNMRKAMLGQHTPCKRRLSFNIERNVTYPLTHESYHPIEPIRTDRTAIDNSDNDEHFENPFRTFNSSSILKSSTPLKAAQLIQIVATATTMPPPTANQANVSIELSKSIGETQITAAKSNGFSREEISHNKSDEIITNFALRQEINLDVASLPNGASLVNGHSKIDKGSANGVVEIKDSPLTAENAVLTTPPNDIRKQLNSNSILTVDGNTHDDKAEQHLRTTTKSDGVHESIRSLDDEAQNNKRKNPNQTLLKMNSMKHVKRPMSMTSSGESDSISDEQISTGPPKSPSPVDSW